MSIEPTTALERFDRNTWLQLLLGTIPYTGGVHKAIAIRVQRIRDERLQRFLQGLQEDVRKLGEQKLNKDFLDSEAFYSVLEFVWTQVAQTRDQEKLRYLRAFFTSTLTNEAPDVTLEELFKKYLISMTGAHLRLLEVIYGKQSRYSRADRAHFPSPLEGEIPLSVVDLYNILPNYPTELIRTLCVDLTSNGLIGDWGATHPGERVQERFYLADNGLAFMREMHRYLT
ncbi:MAG: hypothetical protein AB1716_00875 [Planctomycetota bacterium]